MQDRPQAAAGAFISNPGMLRPSCSTLVLSLMARLSLSSQTVTGLKPVAAAAAGASPRDADMFYPLCEDAMLV